MCGLAGFVHLDDREHPARSGILSSMLRTIAHRGPDDEGTWFDERIALGHRRLSILELSPLGHQPMTSKCGRYVMSFNGEIYNHGSLRTDLEKRGVAFVGRSDSEVLLALIAELGLARALTRCVGMFAIALWDRAEQRLQLARDRFGEKPLYHGICNGVLLFGSELRALREHPSFDPTLDPHAVTGLLEYGWITAPRSIYRSISKVPVGSIVTWQFPRSGLAHDSACRPSCRTDSYWSILEVARAGFASPYEGSITDAVDRVEALLREAVALQMQADVPLGAFLSGGIDSSIVVALMQAQSTRQIKTFTIGFHDRSMDEAVHAKRVAAHLGTDHTELYVRPEEALALIPKLPLMYDEPLADSSQIPTFFVAQLARRSVTVSLSGDGGDELFGGYRKYGLGRRIDAVPARRLIAGLASAVPDRAVEAVGRRVTALRPSRIDSIRILFGARSPMELWQRLSRVNRSPESLLASGFRATLGSEGQATPGIDSRFGFLRTAMTQDAATYLPDDVLAKVDRASMSVSLESRAPLLDHRVAEFAAQLPDALLCDARGGKRPLRELVYRYVPRELVDRPKQGFCLPMARWLRNELREWAYSVFEPGRGGPEVLDLGACRRLLDEHMTGVDDASPQLWAAITLQTWLATSTAVVPPAIASPDGESPNGARCEAPGQEIEYRSRC